MAECCRCHRRLGVLSAKIELLDGVMRTSCFRGLGLPELANDPDNSMGNIRYVARNFLYTPVAGVDAMVQAVLAGRYFSPWYAVGNLAQFDDRRKEVHFSKVGLSVKEDAYIIAYRDLAGCDLLENGKMVESWRRDWRGVVRWPRGCAAWQHGVRIRRGVLHIDDAENHHAPARQRGNFSAAYTKQNEMRQCKLPASSRRRFRNCG